MLNIYKGFLSEGDLYSKTRVKLYSPIVHGRDGLLHPGPGVEGLRLERGAVRHVAEHRHGEPRLVRHGVF